MADKPIIFSAPMITAIIAGRKTQTRRTLKPPPHLLSDTSLSYIGKDGKGHEVRIHTGDRLWVKEAWRTQENFDELSPKEICAEFEGEFGEPSIPTFYEADGKCDAHSIALWQQSQIGRLRSPLHMPKVASRITLVVTDVKIERLQDISEDDAIAEGVVQGKTSFEYDIGTVEQDWFRVPGVDDPGTGISAADMYAQLWEHINGPVSWAANPWIVAVSFDVHLKNIAEMV